MPGHEVMLATYPGMMSHVGPRTAIMVDSLELWLGATTTTLP